MVKIVNPFVTSGYVSPRYFCNREEESKYLMREITNGNNVALISARRMGKTGLIMHCFNKKEIKEHYNLFFIDIYATASLRDFVFALSKEIVEQLKPAGKKAIETFWATVKSLQTGISFDVAGVPSFNVRLGDIQSEETTLDEIFKYLHQSAKPCVIAIDEFQQINHYPEKNVEALLRTHIQHCNNARFIFAGSQRHVMDKIFTSASRPFYQSVSIQHLNSIQINDYVSFAMNHFNENDKKISAEIIQSAYNRFNGITWYVQKLLNSLFAMTTIGGECTLNMIDEAIENNVNSYKYTYSETLFRLPIKQKEVLVAIAKEGDAKAITSAKFIKKHRLSSSSSVQSALRGLLEKDFVTHEKGSYQVYDKFLAIWLNENY
ncbi:MAG: ATP-binding protein [Bacteroidia bacterium]|nr:ATP-binding protein [Bacteroidia bacterium]